MHVRARQQAWFSLSLSRGQATWKEGRIGGRLGDIRGVDAGGVFAESFGKALAFRSPEASSCESSLA